MVLESTERIYRSLKISDMKVVNVGGNNGGHQDTAGQMISQMMASYKAITENMKNDWLSTYSVGDKVSRYFMDFPDNI